jgi:hypothetical protein
MAFFAIFNVDRFGRRFLLMISGSVMALSTLSIGIFFFLKEDEEARAVDLVWLPLTALSI